MKSNHNVLIARNLLVGAGAYYLSKWLVVPLVFGFGKMTQGLIYSGDFNGKIVSQLVWHFPLAVVAFAAGSTVAVLVEGDSRVSWAVFPAILYGLFAFLGHHWALPPDFLDRVGQTLGALFPALTCVIGAWWAARRFPPNAGATPA
jgi:hypothetical protein